MDIDQLAKGMAPTNESPPDVILKGYAVDGLLGRGACAEVYRVRRTGTGLVCAVKVPHPSVRSPGMRERILRECALQKAVQHEGVVRCLGVVEHHGFPCPVTEWVDGPNLRQLVRREGPLSAERAELIFRRLLDAVEAVHLAGIVHRDLKPGNVVLAAGDRPKLTDFGIARGPGLDTPLTSPGCLVGTAGYIAPEQLQGSHEPRASGDIFALGCILYWLVCGEGPFESDLPAMVKLQYAATGRYTRAHALRPDLPDNLRACIDAALEPDPKHRPASVYALRRILEGHFSGLPEAPTETLVLPTKKKRFEPLLAISGSMLALSMAFVWLAALLQWAR